MNDAKHVGNFKKLKNWICARLKLGTYGSAVLHDAGEKKDVCKEQTDAEVLVNRVPIALKAPDVVT